MGEEVQQQFHNVCPARKGFVLNQAVDGTARSYDLTQLLLPALARLNAPDYVFLTLNVGGANDVFWYVDSLVTATLDDTVVNAAGTPWTATSQATTMGDIIKTGTGIRVRIRRNVDKFLHLKCAAAGTANVRISVTSNASDAA